MKSTTVMKSIALLALTSSFAHAELTEMAIDGEIPSGISTKNTQTLDDHYKNKNIKYITFHHQGYANGLQALFNQRYNGQEALPADQRVRNIHGSAVNNTGHYKKFGMFAYHYAVGKNGEIVKGRPIKYKPGTHSPVDFSGHFAVVALGDFDFEEMQKTQKMSYIKVMSEAQRKYKVPTENILPHKHHSNDTLCPGTDIYNQKANLVELTWITSLQAELSSRGCKEVGTADGINGKNTKKAFNRFVRENSVNFTSRSISSTALVEIFDKPSLKCK